MCSRRRCSRQAKAQATNNPRSSVKPCGAGVRRRRRRGGLRPRRPFRRRHIGVSESQRAARPRSRHTSPSAPDRSRRRRERDGRGSRCRLQPRRLARPRPHRIMRVRRGPLRAQWRARLPQQDGAPAQPCVVPRITRRPLHAGARDLRDSGCRLGSVRQGYARKVRPGRVILHYMHWRTGSGVLVADAFRLTNHST
jgi:hypothetical protein